jgi:predicted outer membrane repeat protein
LLERLEDRLAPAGYTVTGLSTTTGPLAGGNQVVISGANFDQNITSVNFGANTLSSGSFIVESATQILVPSVPRQTTQGSVDVYVGNAQGVYSPVTPADQYAYLGAPTITGLSSNVGSVNGGATVTVTGTNLTNATISFGGVPATPVTPATATQAVVTTPADSSGTVDVTASLVGEVSATSTADQYTFAQSITVSSATDAALRQAVATANADAAAGTSALILFAPGLSGQTITLTGGALELNPSGSQLGTITIDGSNLASPVTISGGTSSRIFQVDSGVVTLNDLIFTQGNGTGALDSGDGGAIDNRSILTVRNSSFTSNTAGTDGGAVYNTGTLTLAGDTFSGNTAVVDGGGLYNASGIATAAVSGSTFSANAATQNQGPTSATGGGAIANYGTLTLTNSTLDSNTADNNGAGVYNFGNLTIANSTISNNVVASGGNGAAGIDDEGGFLTLQNSTIAGNQTNQSHSAGGVGVYNSAKAVIADSTISGNTGSLPDGAGLDAFSSTTLVGDIIAGNTGGNGADVDGSGVVSSGHNLIGILTEAPNEGNQTSAGVFLSTDKVGAAALLGTLANNGGPTKTLALQPGSPAIGNGGAVTSLTQSVGPTDTTIYVKNAGAVASTPGQYYISIGGEEMLVTGVNLGGGSLTVVRLTGGTSHAANASVYLLTDQRGDIRAATPDIGAYSTSVASPTITGVAPAVGHGAGGTSVTITGTNLTGATAVNFGSIPAASFVINSPTQITAVAPPEAAGVVDVTVAQFGGATSATSAADKYTYLVPSHPTGTITTTMPTFVWPAVTGAASYTLYLVDATTGQSPALTVPNLTGTTYQLTQAQSLQPGHAYTWYIEAVSTNGTPTFSNGLSFSITGLTAPTGLAPTGPITAAAGYDTPTITWSAVTNADHYLLTVVDQTSPGAPVVNGVSVSGTSYTISAGLTPGHNYLYQVTAASVGNVVEAPSAVQNLTLAPLGAPGSLTVGGSSTPNTVLQPAAGYDTPTFSWSAVTGASHYYLYVMDTTTKTAVVNLNNVTGTSLTSPVGLNPGDSFVWQVGALPADGVINGNSFAAGPAFSLATLSAPGALKVAGSSTPNAVLQPAAGYDTPTFSWSAVTGASHYYLYVMDTTTQTVVVNLNNVTGTSLTSPVGLNPGDSFVWQVGALPADGVINGNSFAAGPAFSLATLSAPGALKVAGSSTPNAVLQPAAGYDTPTFSWSAVTGASHYYLYVMDTTTQTVVVNLNNVTGTSLTSPVGLNPGDSFVWQVGALPADGVINGNSFAAGPAFSLATLSAPGALKVAGSSTPNTVLQPAAGYDQPTFSWSAVTGASQYYLYVKDTTTGNVVVNLNNVTGTSYTVPASMGLRPGDSFTWQVGALPTDGAINGNSFVAGPTFSLAVLAGPPTNLAPTGTLTPATGYDTPTLTWTGVTGANHYQIYLMDNTAGGTPVLKYVSATGTSFQVTGGLTPGHSYTFYVGASSADGAYVVFSQGQTFTLGALAVQL